VDHRKTGLLVEPYDVAALANAMDSIIADPTRTQAMGSAARSRADQFAVDEFIGRITDLYERTDVPA
jgi:glycosyltransferase involved in cell wall biosynthesis